MSTQEHITEYYAEMTSDYLSPVLKKGEHVLINPSATPDQEDIVVFNSKLRVYDGTGNYDGVVEGKFWSGAIIHNQKVLPVM